MVPITGRKMRIRASVKPRRSNTRPTMTLTTMATPTSLVRKTSTTMGQTRAVMAVKRPDKLSGA